MTPYEALSARLAALAMGYPPRDALVAGDFLRHTDAGACLGCGVCASVCPNDAIEVWRGDDRSGVPLRFAEKGAEP